MKNPLSPCIKVCRLQGDVCIGCGRSLAEISAWPRVNAAKRATIRAAAKRRLAMFPTTGTEVLA